MRSAGLLLATAAVAVAVLSACGSDASSDGTPPTTSDAPAAAGTSLTIEVTASEGAEPRTYRLTCDPAGGDHPQPQQACDAIASAGADIFEPVAADQACTMIYGGPQTATIRGTYDGQDVDATFDRADGCETERWDRLGTTVFGVALQ